jgi:hypothetical protein
MCACPCHLYLPLLLSWPMLLPSSAASSLCPRSAPAAPSAAAWFALLPPPPPLLLLLLLPGVLPPHRCLLPCQLPKSTAASDGDASSWYIGSTSDWLHCRSPWAYSTLPVQSQQPCAPAAMLRRAVGCLLALLVAVQGVLFCSSSRDSCCSTCPECRSNRPACRRSINTTHFHPQLVSAALLPNHSNCLLALFQFCAC